MFLWIFPLAAVLAAVFTWFLRCYALSRNLLDVPNDRSSHMLPTPRGGGMSIVLSFLGCLFLLRVAGELESSVFVAVLGAGAWISLVGFLDDHGHILARWRLLAHFVGAGWALAWLGGLPPLPVFGLTLNLGWMGQLLAAVYLVWLLNLYNFMDGIDGIAGIEAVTVCLGGALVHVVAVPEDTGWVLPVLLFSAVTGFLFWNFPKARIFMGDAGSGFLGLMMGVFSIHAASSAPDLFWCWIILLGVFIVDATVTLIRRALLGKKIYEAHRSHAYQYASRKHGAHWRVSLGVGVINLFWVLPFALLVVEGWVGGVVGVLLSYIPLIWIALRYKAGAVDL